MKYFVVNISWEDSFLYQIPNDEEFDETTEVGKLVSILSHPNTYWEDAKFKAEVVEVEFNEPLEPTPVRHLKAVDNEEPSDDNS